MLCIIDYGLGNLNSVKNMFKKIGVAAEISSSPDIIRSAEKLILPGVGAFDVGMENLQTRGLVPVLEEQIFKRSIPILGICLGMQLMSRSSEEGKQQGLGWIDAETKRFAFHDPAKQLPIPHMGWNEVSVVKPHALVNELPPAPRYYFVHSYHVTCADAEDVLLQADYGGVFTAAFVRNNIFGVQFHPEKSHKYGMALLQNFAR
jgi:glutamine amidotransferase